MGNEGHNMYSSFKKKSLHQSSIVLNVDNFDERRTIKINLQWQVWFKNRTVPAR